MNEKSLKSRAMALLSRREYSQQELRKKLQAYAENEAQIDEILADLRARHWQSDTRFAESLVRAKGQKYGRLRLAQELRAKGIDRAEIAEMLPDADDEIARARAVWQKKFKTPAQNYAEKQKQIRFLLYRGFDMDTVMRVINTDFDEEWA